jgi:hypothetical protein
MAYWTSVQVKMVSLSELNNRHFVVKVETEYTELFPVNAGVPRDSVLGPLFYLMYTADMPTSPESTTATIADDTALPTTGSDPAIASQDLQFKTGLRNGE